MLLQCFLLLSVLGQAGVGEGTVVQGRGRDAYRRLQRGAQELGGACRAHSGQDLKAVPGEVVPPFGPAHREGQVDGGGGPDDYLHAPRDGQQVGYHSAGRGV